MSPDRPLCRELPLFESGLNSNSFFSGHSHMEESSLFAFRDPNPWPSYRRNAARFGLALRCGRQVMVAPEFPILGIVGSGLKRLGAPLRWVPPHLPISPRLLGPLQDEQPLLQSNPTIDYPQPPFRECPSRCQYTRAVLPAAQSWGLCYPLGPHL